MNNQNLFLEQALIEAGFLTEAKLADVRAFAADGDLDFIDALTESNAISSRDIALLRADVGEVPFVELDDFEASYANTRLLPQSFAERFDAYALFVIEGVLTLAMDDPLNLEATDQARQITRCEVDAVLCDRKKLRALISRAYSLGQYEEEANVAVSGRDIESEEAEIDQPAVAAVNHLLVEAAQDGASDVHINPDDHILHVRYRIDGILQEKQGPPLTLHSAIVQRLKVMARLDLTQTKRPQDGKFRFTHAGQDVDVRLSTVPTVCGENVVMRLLRRTNVIHDFNELGLPVDIASALEELLHRPYGMVLVTGPTGSGKTTTLYTALSKLNDPSRNLMTIENPVEIRMPYVRQIQTHEEIGLTFATALRSILRQDPDVVLVGEIRDQETAKIATQASLTGHMVLSTLHTNDAAGAVDRLLDFGIPPFVINSALLCVLAQRLVRRVCESCIVPDAPDDLTLVRFGIQDMNMELVKGTGCMRCGQTGYKGRVGVYELMTMTAELRAIIDNSGNVEQLRQIAMQQGMKQLWQDGLEKAQLGQTTLAEVTKVATIVALNDPSSKPEARCA
ncbi:MAG: GspE/PulE family protein [Planctomycetota bacterium]|nr:GspE/PulE family protein [Planctomycetota bacterium]